MSFVISTRAELIKTKRSASFWVCVLGSGFIPLIFLLTYTLAPSKNYPRLQAFPWGIHFGQGWQAFSSFLLPMFVILICSLIPQLEYKNNTWKQVFASPQSLGNIFFSKFMTIHLMILFCFLLFNLFMILSAVAVNIVNKNYPFLSHSIDWTFLLRLSFKTYISILGISALQYWLSLRFKNFIAPIGIGLALLITSLILMQWEHIYKIPYAHPLLTFLAIKKNETSLLANHEWNSIGYFIAFTGLA